MGRVELLAAGERLLAQAGSIRAAYPDVAAMSGLPVADLGPAPPGGETIALAWAALGWLREEMILVRAGRAGTSAVLDDEIACVTRRLTILKAAG